MKVEINVTESFKKAARPLIKKYPSFVNDLSELEKDLIADPEIGIPLGQGAYKIRLRIKSKGKGKSGGARVISLVYREERLVAKRKLVIVNLLTVYDKSEQADIRDSELRKLIETLKV